MVGLTVLLVQTRANVSFVMAEVKHSQKLSVLLAKSWIAAEQSGVVYVLIAIVCRAWRRILSHCCHSFHS